MNRRSSSKFNPSILKVLVVGLVDTLTTTARKRMEIIRKTKAENGVVTLQQIGMVK